MDDASNIKSYFNSAYSGAMPSYGILELRKEKSRDAARSRRGKENYEFYELAKMLPLPAAITTQLDKASIIRLTISYLKLRDFSCHGDPPWHRDVKLKVPPVRSRAVSSLALDLFESHHGTHILQSLDGFAFALGADGRFLYIAETVSIYLGLSQVEMTGSNVFDYIHSQDQAEMAEQLGINLQANQSLPSPTSVTSDEGGSSTPNNPESLGHMTLNSNNGYRGLDRSFCVRMKSTLTKRGCHFKTSGYRVVLILCHLRPQLSFAHARKSPPPLLGMVALAIALPPPSIHELRLEADMFVTRINFDFRIAHCEPRVSELLDYTPDELTGKSLYSLCHAEDVVKLRKSHMDLISKGQVLTYYYRLLHKRGGYTWLQTCATVVINNKNAEEQSIICVNYCCSAPESRGIVLDNCQLEGRLGKSVDDDVKIPHHSPDIKVPAPSPLRIESSPSVEKESTPTPVSSSGMLDHASVMGMAAAEESDSGHVETEIQEENHRGNRRKPDDSSRDLEVSEGKRARVITPDNVSVSGGAPSVGTPGPIGTPASVGTPVHINITDSGASPCSVEADNSNDSTRWKVQCNGNVPENATDPAVKEMESAMSKHLPGDAPTDFSTESLLSKQQRSGTIQWIGAQQSNNTLPASTFLKQLYANRESVIRSNITASRASYYADIHGTLPTPPGSESYGEQSQFLLSSKHSADSYPVLSTYTGTSYSDYQTAMTPPASVSPRDKLSLSETSNYDPMRHQYNADIGLPLKPQVYTVHPGTPVSGIDGSQYSLSEQYSHSTSGGGFHLYHPVPSKPTSGVTYPESIKTSSSWYSNSS